MSLQCYRDNLGGNVRAMLDHACSSVGETGVTWCCAQNHICGNRGFCHYEEAIAGGSGYYLGGCTDPKYEDPACPRECYNFQAQDVVYNQATGLWSCCYSNPDATLNCSSPLNNVTFSDPSADILFSTTYSYITTLPTSTSSAIASPTNANLTTSTVFLTEPQATDSAGGLSEPAAIGIGVGFGVVAIVIIILVSILLKRKIVRKAQINEGNAIPQYSSPANLDTVKDNRAEITATGSTAEMQQTSPMRPIHELSDHNVLLNNGTKNLRPHEVNKTRLA